MTTQIPSTFGVRARILATVLVLAAIGMAIAGGSFTVFERGQELDHIDSVLVGNAEEFRNIAETAASGDALDGESVTVSGLLEKALRQHVSSDTEDLVGVLNGQIRFEVLQAHPAAHDDPAFVAKVAAITPQDPVVVRQVETNSVGLVRYVAVPVQVEGDPDTGMFVSSIALDPVLHQLRQSTFTYAGMSIAALILIGLGGWFVAGRLLRPLALINDAARQISHTDLSARIPVRGNDDVSALTRTVNSMLDRLQRAFATQQAFLDDAGHELRTPLTIVRGHLELVDPDSPEDIHTTHALVIDELDRMARLVNDLIVLAQSGRPDFVRFTPVDLNQLMRDILAKAPGLADREWILEAAPNLVVMADAHRLTQALLQLTDNAVRHTHEQDVIAFGGRGDAAGFIELWVRDTGPGVPKEDQERIFERFGRAERESVILRQAQGRSSGLGLSIVAGIATAHCGTVLLDDAYTDGARFVLRMRLQVLGPSVSDDAGLDGPGAGATQSTTDDDLGAEGAVLTSLFQPYAPTKLKKPDPEL